MPTFRVFPDSPSDKPFEVASRRAARSAVARLLGVKVKDVLRNRILHCATQESFRTPGGVAVDFRRIGR